jgi:hypothetical protein
MAVTWDRFELLNQPAGEVQVMNMSFESIADLQIDEEAVVGIPCRGSVTVPPGTTEIKVRRQIEEDPPVDIAIIVTS